VQVTLVELFVALGLPAHLSSDKSAKSIANDVQQWLAKIGVKTLNITPGCL